MNLLECLRSKRPAARKIRFQRILAGHVGATMPVARGAGPDIVHAAMPTPAWTPTERAAHNGQEACR